MGNEDCCRCCYIVCPQRQVEKEHGFFYSTQTARNSALYGGLRFTEQSNVTEGIVSDEDIIDINKPGMYFIIYTIFLPAGTTVNTKFVVQLNNQNIEGTVRNINQTSSQLPTTITAHTIIDVDAPSRLRLSSSRIISISGQNNDTMVSITIVQI